MKNEIAKIEDKLFIAKNRKMLEDRVKEILQPFSMKERNRIAYIIPQIVRNMQNELNKLDANIPITQDNLVVDILNHISVRTRNGLISYLWYNAKLTDNWKNLKIKDLAIYFKLSEFARVRNVGPNSVAEMEGILTQVGLNEVCR